MTLQIHYKLFHMYEWIPVMLSLFFFLFPPHEIARFWGQIHLF